MKKIHFLAITFIITLLSGCAGALFTGSATAIYIATDPRTTQELLNDKDLSLQIIALGNKAPYQFNVRVNASVFRGNVLLMGQAALQEHYHALEAEVRRMKGVKVIYNQMKIKPLLSVPAISKDAWLTTKVKSALIANDELRGNKITVYTEDTEVFLTGSVSPYHAEKAVDIARHISGVGKVIKAFHYGEQAKQDQQKQAEILTETAASLENVEPISPTDEESDISPTDEESDILFIEPVEEVN